MAKKTKNKFVNSIQVDWDTKELFKDVDPDVYKDIDITEYTRGYAFTEDNKIIQCFTYLKDGKPFIIPEPEPSLMFFRNAENKIENILKSREKVLTSSKPKDINEAKYLFSLFFNHSFDFIINLFASIEAFNNSVIPENYEFRDKRKLYSREKIQRFIPFDTKTKTIIPEIFKKSFIDKFNKDYTLIENLKNIRNNLIHTKNQSDNWAASYRNIYMKILEFQYEETYSIVKKYMNFYKCDWIQDELKNESPTATYK